MADRAHAEDGGSHSIFLVPAKNRYVYHKKKKRRGAPQGRNGPLPTAQCGLMTPLRSPEGHGHPTGALRPRLGEWRFRVFFFFFFLYPVCELKQKNA